MSKMLLNPQVQLRRNPPLAQRKEIAEWVTQRATMGVSDRSEVSAANPPYSDPTFHGYRDTRQAQKATPFSRIPMCG